MSKARKPLLTIGIAMCLFGGSLTSAQGADPVTVPAGFTILGSGYGHGIGLSQYGAQGMALAGKTATEILTYYYQGTTVDAIAIPNANIRVGLIQDKTFVALRGEIIPGTSGGGAFNVVIDSNPAQVVAAGVVATFTTVNGLTQVSANGNVLGSGTTVSITWDKTVTVINVGSGTDATLASASLGTTTCAANNCSRRYKYGSLEISSGLFGDSVADLLVVNTLRLSDEYLYGLGEVPSSWADAALQAQAIAGRSYAINKTSNVTGCNCQIYATTLDQAFIGYSKEIGTSGDRWVAAVNATIVNASTAYAVQYLGVPISTYYSSSTGGKSQDVREVWGETNLPYLISVDDPWSLVADVNNANSAWTDSIDQATLVANLLAIGIVIADVKTISVSEKYSSGGASKLALSDSAGNIYNFTVGPSQTITPDRLRTVLGVKSTYISSIEPGLTSVPATTPAIVAAPAAPLPAAKPAASVAGKLALSAPNSAKRNKSFKLSGSVTPQLSGVTVTIERRIGSGSWKKLGTVRTNKAGQWQLTAKSGSKKTTLSYRVKTTDRRLGKVTSATVKLSVK